MKSTKYKFYKLETTFAFGKHEGKTLLQVCISDEKYVDWCLINLEHFNISDETISFLKILNIELNLSSEADQRRYEKCDEWNERLEARGNYEANEQDDYGTSSEKYNGYNGWNDDTIDDAFEGDPENTWNVD